MDSLRPDRDDLDLYKNRKNTSSRKSGTKNESASSVKAGDRAPVGGISSTARRVDVQSAGGPKVREPIVASSAPSPRSGSSAMLVSCVCILLLAVSGLSYLFWQQSKTIGQLEQRLLSTDEFMGQSKLLFARLEGEVSETGAELVEAGTSVEKKLAFLESEVRKLWGVSYDRNRKSIQNNEKEIKSLAKTVSKNSKGVSAQSIALSTLESESKKGVEVLDGRVSSLSGELSITRAEHEQALSDLKQELVVAGLKMGEVEGILKSLQKQLSASVKVQKESQQNLSSVDESRRQLIKRVVDLENRLDKLSANNASKASLVTPK